MTDREKRRNSLESKVFHATVLTCIIIGIVALFIGLGLYMNSLLRQLISRSFNISENASVPVMSGQADAVGFANQVMELYNSLSDEERAENGTDEYRARFAALEQTMDYKVLLDILKGYCNEDEVDDVYLVMYDREHSVMVYIVDPDPNESARLYPGEWESVERTEMERFLDWNGEGELYDLGNTEKYGWLCTAGVPIRDENNNIVAFVLSDVTVNTVISNAKDFVIPFVIVILIATVIVALLWSKRIRRTIVKPINDIAQVCTEYMNDKKNHELGKDRFAMLNIKTGDEIENLSLVLADMERDMQEYLDDLTVATAEKERINTELDMAAKIQTAMLPHIFPPFPDRKEIDIYATMEPAKEIGGDFYDFFLIDDDHLCLVMADVSGKGVPAALFMMVTKVLIQSCAMLGVSASEILGRTNHAICKDNQLGLFVTVWLGILEISTGKLTTVNAGHEYPALLRKGGRFEFWKEKHNFVVGGFDDEIYEEHVTYLKPGDRVFVYTDGVPEAMDSSRNLFGTDRMLTALNKDTSASAHGVLINVRSAVNAFVKEAEQYDDLTMLCMEYKGPNAVFMPF